MDVWMDGYLHHDFTNWRMGLNHEWRKEIKGRVQMMKKWMLHMPSATIEILTVVSPRQHVHYMPFLLLKCQFKLQDSSQHAVLFLSCMHTSKTWLWTEILNFHRIFICCLTQLVGSARHKELVLQVLYKDLATNAAHRRASYVVEAALNNCSPQDGWKMEKRGGWDDSLTVKNAFPQ